MQHHSESRTSTEVLIAFDEWKLQDTKCHLDARKGYGGVGDYRVDEGHHDTSLRTLLMRVKS